MWHDDGMGWGMMLWGGAMMILFWAVIVGLIVWAVQSVGRRERRDRDDAGYRTTGRAAADIARERYARGEIDKDEFEQIVSILEQHGPTGAQAGARGG